MIVVQAHQNDHKFDEFAIQWQNSHRNRSHCFLIMTVFRTNEASRQLSQQHNLQMIINSWHFSSFVSLLLEWCSWSEPIWRRSSLKLFAENKKCTHTMTTNVSRIRSVWNRQIASKFKGFLIKLTSSSHANMKAYCKSSGPAGLVQGRFAILHSNRIINQVQADVNWLL